MQRLLLLALVSFPLFSVQAQIGAKSVNWGPFPLSFQPEKLVAKLADGNSLYSLHEDQYTGGSGQSLMGATSYVVMMDDGFDVVRQAALTHSPFYKYRENFLRGKDIVEVFAKTDFIGKEVGLFYRVVDLGNLTVKQDFTELKAFGKDGSFVTEASYSPEQDKLLVMYLNKKDEGWIEVEWRLPTLTVSYTQQSRVHSDEKKAEWSLSVLKFFKDGSCVVNARQAEEYDLTTLQKAEVVMEDKLILFSPNRSAVLLTGEGKTPSFRTLWHEDGSLTVAVVKGVGTMAKVYNQRMAFGKKLSVMSYDASWDLKAKTELDLGDDAEASYDADVMKGVRKSAGSDFGYPNVEIGILDALPDGGLLVSWTRDKVVLTLAGKMKVAVANGRMVDFAKLDGELDNVWQQSIKTQEGDVHFDGHAVDMESGQLWLYGNGRKWLSDMEKPGKFKSDGTYYAIVELDGSAANFVTSLRPLVNINTTNGIRTESGWVKFDFDRRKKQVRVEEITLSE